MPTGFQIINLSKLKPALWNYKEPHYEIEAKLKENIIRNKIIENLVVRELGKGEYEVVDGNNRLSVFTELNI